MIKHISQMIYKYFFIILLLLFIISCNKQNEPDFLRGNWSVLYEDKIYYEFSFNDSIVQTFYNQVGVLSPQKYEFNSSKMLLKYAGENIKISKINSNEFIYNWSGKRLHFKRMPEDFKFTLLETCGESKKTCSLLLQEAIVVRELMMRNENFSKFKKALEERRSPMEDSYIQSMQYIYNQVDLIYLPIAEAKYIH